MLLFFRNDTGFGGNNGFTDFKRILDVPIATPQTRMLLFGLTAAVLIGTLLLGRALVPFGYMPGAGGLVLCPAYGPAQAAGGHAMAHSMAMDMPGHDMSAMDMGPAAAKGGAHAGHEGMAHEGSCAYATSASGSALSTVHSLPAVAYVPSTPNDVPSPAERLIPRGTIVPTRLPRGPPALS